MPATVYAPTTTTSYTDTGEILVLVDASAGDVTITVPTASSRTAPVTVRRTDGSQNLCKVKPHTGENFDADAIGYFLISLGASVKLVPSSSSSYATANADGVWASGNAIAMPRLFAWWRADKGVISSGGAVSQWSDQSGNSNHVTQSTAANRPTVVSAQLNGLPVVRFTGTNSQYFDMFSWLGGQAFSFLIVAKSSGTGCGYDSILRWQVTTTYLVYPWNNGNGAAANQLILSTDGGTGGPSAGFLNNQWNIGYCSYAINRNATGFVTAQTGTTIATATSATTLLPKGMPGWMGGYVAANAEYTTADVAEIMIFFEDALSNASWRALVQIMRERWGL